MRRTRRTGLLALLAASLVSACTVVFITEMEINISVDGETSAGACADFGVAQWDLSVSSLRGQPLDRFTLVCGEAWSTGVFSIQEGVYRVTARALDAKGKSIGPTKSRDVELVDDGRTIWTVDFDFTADDLGGKSGPYCGDGTCDDDEDHESCPDDCAPPAGSSVIISWKINGTVDGTETGPSWDTCDEVGALKVRITIDGEETLVPCADNDQSTTIQGLVEGEHEAEVVLLDGDHQEITTVASDKVFAAVEPPEEPFDFPYTAFIDAIKHSITGDYLFQTLFEAESRLKCAETSPQVGVKAYLLKLDGEPVEAQACYPDASSCVSTNGDDLGVCLNQQQTIADLPWGAYVLKITAAPPGGDLDDCWMTDNGEDDSGEIDILVGAGPVNPVVEHILERISDSGDCAP